MESMEPVQLCSRGARGNGGNKTAPPPETEDTPPPLPPRDSTITKPTVPPKPQVRTQTEIYDPVNSWH